MKILTHSVENVAQIVPLLHPLHFQKHLFYIGTSSTHSSNSDEQVVIQKVWRKLLDVSFESGREHESLSLGFRGKSARLNKLPNAGLKSHV